jgi:hypothetical protein
MTNQFHFDTGARNDLKKEVDALENAASIAGFLLFTDCVLFEKRPYTKIHD